jgi:GT2 family glycosyltransferase
MVRQENLQEPFDDNKLLPQLTDGVWAIVVTYNSGETIKDCLDSLYASSNTTVVVVVVDNSSDDQTARIVQEKFPDVLFVQSDENLGFPGGCNLAMRIAISRNARYMFFLNPDAEVSHECVESLVQFLKSNESVGVVSPIITDKTTGRISYGGAAFDLRHRKFELIGVGEQDLGQFDQFKRTGRPHGGAMMVRREAVDAVGLMDESYFLYWEETEWISRFMARGFEVGLCPLAKAYHRASHSTGGDGSPLYEYYILRNRLRFITEKTETSKLSVTLNHVPRSTIHVAGILHRHGIKASFAAGFAIFMAYRDFWRNRFGERLGLKNH